MKVTTTREILQKDGTKTTIVIEENLNDVDDIQLKRHLNIVGFYNSETLLEKTKRVLKGD